jgi:hypothetical protein
MLQHRREKLITGLLFLTLFAPVFLLLFDIWSTDLLSFVSLVSLTMIVLANFSEIRQRKFNSRNPYTYASLMVAGINVLFLLPYLSLLIELILNPSEFHLYLLAIIAAGVVWHYLLKKYDPIFVLVPFLVGNVLLINNPRMFNFLPDDAGYVSYLFVVAICILVSQHAYFTSHSREEIVRVVSLSFICIFLPLLLAALMSF